MMPPLIACLALGFAALLVFWCGAVQAESGDAGLAQELTNPVADLLTVPIQIPINIDRRIGAADDGTKVTMDVQPAIPSSASADWNVISRTIVPVVCRTAQAHASSATKRDA